MKIHRIYNYLAHHIAQRGVVVVAALLAASSTAQAQLTTDVTKPVATITAPANAATIVDTLPVTISGTATDNVGIAKVQISLDGGVSFTDAIVSTGRSATAATYTLDVQPLPGLNNLRVRAIDLSGNVSALVARTFTHLRTLSVVIPGPGIPGTVTAGFGPTSARQVGKSYTITATPKAGFVFDGWVVNNVAGTSITPAKAEFHILTFTMQPGLILTANFIYNPFYQVTGDYSGLIMPNPAGGSIASNATVGFCHATLTTTGALTGNVRIDGLTLPFTARCDNTGVARFGLERAKSLTLLRPNKPGLVLTLKIDLTGGTKQLTGTLTEGFRRVTVAENIITANRHAFNSSNKVPAAYVKKYTARLKARVYQGEGFSKSDYPQGDGYLTFNVNSNGMVLIVGKLADGTDITAFGALSESLHWPIFVSLYGGKGCIAADAALDDTKADTDATAMNMLWFRPFQNVQWYPYGWDEGIFIDMLACKFEGIYFKVWLTNRVTGNSTLSFSEGLLASPVTKPVEVINLSNKATKVQDADLSFSLPPFLPNNGVIKGIFTHTDGTQTKWEGVVIRKSGNFLGGANDGGHGFFLTRYPATINYLGESGAMHWLRNSPQ